MWNNQASNIGSSIKLVVYFTDDQPKRVQTYHAFKSEEQSDKAIINMRKRILQRLVLGIYKTAIFYRDGVEVERWVDGVRES